MIGIFDSGAGGLSVVKALRAARPDFSIVYFGDTARFPYGAQSQEQLQRYTGEVITYLQACGAQIIVAACHSASAAAGERFQKDSPVPFFDMVTPSAAAALAATRRGRIGVIGTKATVRSGVYERLLTVSGILPVVRATPMLVPLVEERWWRHPESRRIVRRSLAPLKAARVDTLVLACTHYPLIQPLIASVMGDRVTVVNPSHEVVRAVLTFLEQHPDIEKRLTKDGRITYGVSSDPGHFQVTAEWWLGQKIKVEAVNIGRS